MIDLIILMHIRYLDFLFYFCKTMVHQRYSTCFNYLSNLSLLPYTVLDICSGNLGSLYQIFGKYSYCTKLNSTIFYQKKLS